MSWAKLDDRANEHRKQLEAGPEACWLWACGLMYANRQPARDGHIPARVLPMLYPFPAKQLPKLAAKLVQVGLWTESTGGYDIHQFKIWNKTKEQVEEDREATRERVARHRRNKNSNGSGNEVGNGVTPDDVPDPIRSAPLPLHSEPSESGTHATAISNPPEQGPESDLKLTLCPLNLTETAEKVGIVSDFVERYRAEPEQIRDAVREFVTHWTIGSGQGRREGNWPKKLRGHLKHTCERLGGLKPPGAIAHEETTSQVPYHAPVRRVRDTGPVMPPNEAKAAIDAALAGMK